jgi:hypothetical protein
MLIRVRPLAAIANEQVPFTTAAKWAGLGSDTRDRGLKTACPSCGEAGAMRVYPGHGYCFAERRGFSSVSLLAEVWEMSREAAAVAALEKIGYRPPGYEDLWEGVQREPEVAREALATALRTWCAANCPDWTRVQYDGDVARVLPACLARLPLVRTEADCTLWLEKCKQVMGRVFPRP